VLHGTKKAFGAMLTIMSTTG